MIHTMLGDSDIPSPWRIVFAGESIVTTPAPASP